MKSKVKRIKVKDIENNKKAEFNNYISDFDYLIDNKVVIPSFVIDQLSSFPLLQSTSKKLLKLYFNDVGLLSNILYKNNVNTILFDQEDTITLGSIYETAVANELNSHNHELFYFNSKKIGDVDFLINDYDSQTILPIIIKSGKINSTFKTLSKLIDNNSTLIDKGYIFYDQCKIKKQNNIFYLPIYIIMFL